MILQTPTKSGRKNANYSSKRIDLFQNSGHYFSGTPKLKDRLDTSKKKIIKRVLEKGNMREKKENMNFYGQNKFKKIITLLTE
jgi:hypothetical protein